MNRKLMNYLAAFLLIIAAVWNIRCESEKRNIRQAQFQQYLHINSRQYKQSLKMDSLFALRLDSIKLLQRRNGKERIDSIRLK